MTDKKTIIVGKDQISINDVIAVAYNNAQVQLVADDEWRQRIQRGADFLDQLLEQDGVIYGVTTGYGDSCVVSIPNTKQFIAKMLYFKSVFSKSYFFQKS